MKYQSRGPRIVAIALLILPALYVGSYLVLVVPEGILLTHFGGVYGRIQYRVQLGYGEKAYWPVEQIDRRLRPGAWTKGSERIRETSGD